MTINGTNYLLLKGRGCPSFETDERAKASDVGNYRVFVRFTDKAGVDVYGDFLMGNRRRYTDKTGKLLKKPVTISTTGIFSSLCYENERGCFGYRPDLNLSAYSYTISDILAIVNAISAEHYDAIKWVESFDFVQPAGANFTPANQIVEWAKKNWLEVFNVYGEMVVKFYTGQFKYLCYQVKPLDSEKEKVTIILEAA